MDEDAFVGWLVDFFRPKALKAFIDGFAWWEFARDVTAILDAHAVARVAGLSRRKRIAALAAYRNRLHPRVLAALKEEYPKANLQ